MGKLHQVQLRYQPLQDRALLRFNTRDRQEYRFWLTRRYVKVLWPVLVDMAEKDAVVESQSHAHARKTVLSFQHEQALAETDFDTTYQDAADTLPLGDEPLLLRRVSVRRDAAGRRVLFLGGEGRHGIELSPDARLLHSLCRLLEDTTRKAGWDLELRLASPPEMPGEAGIAH
jgi:hypothetical protein